jgi:hypothetical protein
MLQRLIILLLLICFPVQGISVVLSCCAMMTETDASSLHCHDQKPAPNQETDKDCDGTCQLLNQWAFNDAPIDLRPMPAARFVIFYRPGILKDLPSGLLRPPRSA